MSEQARRSTRLRGAIVKLVCGNHDRQGHRFDLEAVWSALVRGLGFTVSKREVKTTLQDLSGRGYLTFKDRYDEDADDFLLFQIELTPKGRDLYEKRIDDPAVEM